MSKVGFEVLDGVALVTLNRPEVLNALDADVFNGLLDAARRAEADPAARAVLIAGEGRAFCSGLDTSLFGLMVSGSEEGLPPATFDISALQEPFTAFERISKPTVAALHGPTFGGGLQLALGCDLRIAADDARLSAFEIRWGIIPDLGGTTRLPKLVGLGRAKEMIMTGREVSPEEAQAWGLVNRVVPAAFLREEAMTWARELAAGPPLALAAAKRLALAALDVTVDEGLDREIAAQRRILASRDFVEAVTARIEKRSPQFEAR